MLADPPWRFSNRTGKVAPEHRRLARYQTLTAKEIAGLPVAALMAPRSHCYLWVPNALLAEGLMVMENWGFTYKANLVWHKVRKDGGSDGRGVGFYFRNVTELVLFGSRGQLRTLAPGRRQVNLLATRKREHRASPTKCTSSSNAARPDRTWSCSPVTAGRAGRPGATKHPTSTAEPRPSPARPGGGAGTARPIVSRVSTPDMSARGHLVVTVEFAR